MTRRRWTIARQMRLVAVVAVLLAMGPLVAGALSALVLFFAAILYIGVLVLRPLPPDRPDDPIL
jgi:hypothetical protein